VVFTHDENAGGGYNVYCLGIILILDGGWETLKPRQKNLAGTWCPARTPDMRIRILERVYQAVCEYILMKGTEIRGLEGLEEIDTLRGIFCRNVLKMAIAATELKMGGDRRRGKALCLAVKYWQSILHVGRDE
jgi:hypothetical protein